ncbi:twin-arginine translocation signal domain-containing protein [Haloarcula salinisoli]|uniref:Twin-arginine translocation signal domain-containing protein n=1 Tax=Haloarcula salinisoli TaxID=2487746 RepID=A0A8J8C805_9EURY|nr:twin-arginine translocation signal domain-containing protein [Halomicroarcula salinisoli]MBX0302639.1 twin-arginine translocation signal domain-containing protein [Halomicroarcula salinisoli]
MTRDDDTSRRRFLLGTGVAIGTVGLAGCGIPGGGGGEEEEEEGGGEAEEEDGGGEEEEEDGGGEEEEEEEQLQGPEAT